MMDEGQQALVNGQLSFAVAIYGEAIGLSVFVFSGLHLALSS